MRKTKVIAFANNKGGSGKTTTCSNIACAMAMDGKRVLMIDGDMQLNLTISYFDEERALAYAKNGKNICEVSDMPIPEAAEFIRQIDDPLARDIKTEILKRMNALIEIGLSYLSLSRGTDTLSGGEAPAEILVVDTGDGTDVVHLVQLEHALEAARIDQHASPGFSQLLGRRGSRDCKGGVVLVAAAGALAGDALQSGLNPAAADMALQRPAPRQMDEIEIVVAQVATERHRPIDVRPEHRRSNSWPEVRAVPVSPE